MSRQVDAAMQHSIKIMKQCPLVERVFTDDDALMLSYRYDELQSSDVGMTLRIDGEIIKAMLAPFVPSHGNMGGSGSSDAR